MIQIFVHQLMSPDDGVRGLFQNRGYESIG